MESTPQIKLQGFEGAVADVPAPGNRAKRRVGHNVRRRHGQIGVGRRQDVCSFVAEIAKRAALIRAGGC